MLNSVLDCHCHSIASGHAYSTIKEYAVEASEKGLELIGITEHGPATPGMAFGDIYFLNFKVVPDELFGVEILKGVELNILDAKGGIDLSEDLIGQLDVAIASLHDCCIAPSSKEENTKAIINAIKNPYINIIGHLGDPAFPVCVEDIVKAALDYNTALEINEASTIGYRSAGVPVIIEMAKLCKVMGTPVIWGTDAHFHTAVGKFENSKKISIEAGFEECDILNTSVKRFKDFLKK